MDSDESSDDGQSKTFKNDLEDEDSVIDAMNRLHIDVQMPVSGHGDGVESPPTVGAVGPTPEHATVKTKTEGKGSGRKLPSIPGAESPSSGQKHADASPEVVQNPSPANSNHGEGQEEMLPLTSCEAGGSRQGNIPNSAAPTTAKAKPESKISTVLSQGNGSGTELPLVPAAVSISAGKNAADSSPGIVQDPSPSHSNPGSGSEEVLSQIPCKAGGNQEGNITNLAEELWNKLPTWRNKDVRICYRTCSNILLPSDDVDIDESSFYQLLFLEQYTWCKYFQNLLCSRQISFKVEDGKDSGRKVVCINVDNNTQEEGVDMKHKLCQLVQECGIRVRLIDRHSLACRHILQAQSPPSLSVELVKMYRSHNDDKLILVGREADMKEVLTAYGCDMIHDKESTFEESYEISDHDAWLFNNLYLRDFLQFEKYHVKCQLFQGEKNVTLIYTGISLKDINKAAESVVKCIAQVRCEVFNLSEEKLYLLKEIEAYEYVKVKLRKKCFPCGLDIGDKYVQIFCVKSDHFEVVRKEIEACFNKHIASNISNDGYQKLMKMVDNFKGKVRLVWKDQSYCTVVCTSDISDRILRIIISFSATGTFSLSICEAEMNFLFRHCLENLKGVENKFGIKITAMKDGLQVEGNSGINMDEVKKEIGLICPKFKTNIPIDPSHKDFILSQDGRMYLSRLADENGTLCILPDADAGEDTCDNVLCSWYCGTKGQQILLVQGRAADLSVDCLVIPVNGSIMPETPAEHGLQDSFDEEMRKEISAKVRKNKQNYQCSEWIIGEQKGKLKCRKKPVYLVFKHNTQQIAYEELLDKLKDIFHTADASECESVGLLLEYYDGIPESEVIEFIRPIIEAVSLFFKEGHGQTLTTIYLCTMEKQDIDSRINAVEKNLQETGSSASKHSVIKVLKSKLKIRKDDIQTMVKFCSLDQAKTDVLVNTVAKCLDLDSGAVSKQIKKRAGQGLLEELKKMYKDGIESMEIATTEPYDLRSSGCKKLFHVAVDSLESNIKEKVQMLKVLTLKCLKKAEEMDMSSIAFPALGTGKLEYPYRDVAWAMFEAVDEFRSARENQHLKKVRFVIYEKDTETVQAFLLEESRRNKERHDGTKPKRGKVPETIRGRLKNGNRPEFDIAVVEKEYPVPSFVVKVFFQISSGALEHSYHKADCKKEEWNDWYLIKTSDDREMFKKGIQNCLIDAAIKRITHLLFYMCKVSKVGWSTPPISWTFSHLPVNRPAELKIYLLSDTQDHLQNAEKAIIKKLGTLAEAVEPLEIDSVFEKGTAQLNTAVYMSMKESGFLEAWIKSVEDQYGFQCEDKEQCVKITGQVENLLYCQDWVQGALDTECLRIKMDEDEKILLCETEFVARYIGLFKAHSYSGPEMIITCKREKSDEIQKAFDERLKSLRKNEKYEIKLETTPEISKVREYLKNLDLDCFVKEDNSGFVVVMWATHQEYIKQKNRLMTELGLREITKNSRKNRQYRAGEVRLPAEKETEAFDKASLKGDNQLGAAFETEEGLVIRVYEGDITKLDVDCIVNAANERLSNGAGVAKAIEDAAGLQYKEECAKSVQVYGLLNEGDVRASTGGDLNCKEILNAVGPRWDSYSDKTHCREVLRETIKKCLKKSNDRGHKIIALPSVSAGLFGVPLDICIQEYCQAVISFSKETARDLRQLEEVHFVDIIQRNVDSIERAFSKCFTGASVSCNSASSVNKTTSSLKPPKKSTVDVSDLSASKSFNPLGYTPTIQQGEHKAGQHIKKQSTGHQDVTEYPGSSSMNIGEMGQKQDMIKPYEEIKEFNPSTQAQTQQSGYSSLKMEGTMPSTMISSKGIPAQFPFFTALGGKLKIYVADADITAISVDAIVSTEDPNLCSKGAIARAIKKVAADGFDRNEFEIARSKIPLDWCDVVATHANVLPCKFILHTVSPHWGKQAVQNTQKFEASLSLAVFNILKTAEERTLESVAIPLLGTSENEDKMPTPVPTCARGMIQGLLTFLKFDICSNIKQVKFVCTNQGIVKIFLETLFLSCDEATVGRNLESTKSGLDNNGDAFGSDGTSASSTDGNCVICKYRNADDKFL